jgi:hypothetical protein
LVITPGVRKTTANTWTALQTFTASPGIDLNNTAPSLTFTDTTASAKSLTIAVDANLAQFKESVGAAALTLNLSTLRATFGENIVVPGTVAIGSNALVISQSGFSVQLAQLYVTGVSGFGGAAPTGGVGMKLAGSTNDSSTHAAFFTRLSGVSIASFRSDGRTEFGNNSLSTITIDDSNALTWLGLSGQKYTLGHKTELTTIAAAATTATTITIPANAILKAVTMRVTTVIPTAATMVVTATTTGTVLQQGASIAVAAGTTDIGTRAWGTNYQGVAAQTITITPNATPVDNTGRVRFDIYYEEPTVATS